MIKLVKPNREYYQLYKDMMDEWNMEGSRIAPWALHLKYHTLQYFDEMIKRVQEVEKGENLEGYAASTTYGIRPSERKKGYATQLLKLTLVEAKIKNIDEVLLGAYIGNIGS